MNELRRLVRPILTLVGFGALTYTFLTGMVSTEVYVPMVGMMLAFWFSEEK